MPLLGWSGWDGLEWYGIGFDWMGDGGEGWGGTVEDLYLDCISWEGAVLLRTQGWGKWLVWGLEVLCEMLDMLQNKMNNNK